jgi:hypothetical protein
MRTTLITPEAQPTLAWRNGGGLTRQIVRVGPETGYAWRASLARVDQDGPFSAFPEHRRLLTLIDGGPLTLEYPGGMQLDVAPRLKPHALPDGEPPYARIGEAAASVFNLIYDPQQVQAQLLPRPLVGGMVFFDTAATDWLIYLLSGEAELRLGEQHQWLGPFHGLLLEGDGSAARAVLNGGGEVVLAKLTRG